ncbi:10699_t:CDS:2 [Funneliformis geosporum]|uniref:9719_t:CDS:1 n=1 Tax=Funneliformis geosporum TaxID=1117311 RepID=A0A9W4WRY7_9GLOM|nr:9719_t:CDS:2 [Funneliformis geosporum]CAI2184693.1 10699_t:CDS:2 [Funneliformis geosporum]
MLLYLTSKYFFPTSKFFLPLKKFPNILFSNNYYQKSKNSFLKNNKFYSTLRLKDTIYALSTAQGKAGIAIIRVSGSNALQAIEDITADFSEKPVPRKATLKTIIHPKTKEVIDHGLILWFPGPKSYTGENLVEFHIHGGTSVVRGVLDALGNMENFRHAEAGEFTRRAFENVKFDLTEIEGLADLLNAETEAQRRQALRQVQGGLKILYENWRKQLINNMASIEAIIDFGEDENIEDGVFEKVAENVKLLKNDIIEHLNDNRRGEILRDGIRVTILGPPNVGKSSFLNYLAQRKAAIVSHIPGTTRDIVDISLDFGGYPIIISDTAGLRPSDDDVEIEGISRAKDRIKTADIKIIILSSLELLHSIKSNHNYFSNIDSIIKDTVDDNTYLIINKSDLVENKSDLSKLKQISLKSIPVNYVWCLSCLSGEGFNEFQETFINSIKQKYDSLSSQIALITQARHREHLSDCLKSLENFLELNDLVLAAEELRFATHALGRITGRVDVEEILGVIFQQFCIGK